MSSLDAASGGFIDVVNLAAAISTCICYKYYDLMYKEKINYTVSYTGVRMVEAVSECHKRRVLESYHMQIAYICISELLFKD